MRSSSLSNVDLPDPLGPMRIAICPSSRANETSSTADTDYGRFIENDKPGSRLRHEFELMRTLKQKGIPFVASVWRLPEWMLADRGTKAPFDPGRRVAARIRGEAMATGLLCYPMGGTIDGRLGDHVLLAPPFIISDDELDLVIERLVRAVDASLAGALGQRV